METLILNKILTDSNYSSHVFPFVRLEYFFDKNNKRILTLLINHIKKYQKIPSFDEIEKDINDFLPENIAPEVSEQLSEIKASNKDIIYQKMLDDTESYFKDVAIQNAIIECATAIENKKTNEYNNFPEILKKALIIDFDNKIGVDFKSIDDIKSRYEAYITKPSKIELGTQLFNKVTDGGYERKTLNIYIAPTNVGKTWKLVDDAANFFRNGYNVLYVTLEMSEEKIMQRIETNLFELPTRKFKNLSFDEYTNYLRRIKPFHGKKLGRLITKEYPTSAATIGHLNILLDDLQLKKDFIPDVIIIDYLSIMAPLDQKYGNMYDKNKIISEELRRLAVERNVCMITGTQTNRSGYSVSDFDLTSTSESIAITFIADFICAIIRDEELDKVNEIWVKILKNRYEPIVNNKFTLGTNVHHQKFFDVGQDENSDLNELFGNEKKSKDFSDFKY